MAGIYIHIPFCKKKCHYCDFYFTINHKNIIKLIDAIKLELELRKKFFKKNKIDTIYFGGGTPSMINPDLIGEVIKSIFLKFQLSKKIEITLESNPDDINEKNILKWKKYGVNRISLGIQTLNNESLTFINRNHNRSTSLNAIKMLSDNFNNYSVDLMYGIPKSSLNIFKNDLNEIIKYNPPHISAYNMTIEKRTVFSHWLKKGIIKVQNENEIINQFLYLTEFLKKKKYIHYEISNFCKPGFSSKHNTSYWKRKKYLGLGPSAHSFDGKARSWNISNNKKYISSINKKNVFHSEEKLSQKMLINEAIMIGVRTMWGIDNNYLTSNLKYDILKKQKLMIQKLIKEKLITVNKAKIITTKKGALVSNYISEKLFV